MKEYIDWIIQSRKTEIDRNKEDKLSYADGLYNVYYRGHASISWELNASIFREPYKDDILGQRRSSVAGLTEDDRQTVDKERQVGDPMQLRTEVLNL